MTATPLVTVATILGLFWALPLLAQSGEAQPGDEKAENSRQAIWAKSQTALLEGIVLSANQRSQIEALDVEFADQMDERQQNRSQLRSELNTAQQAGKVSVAKRIRSQLRELRRTPARATHLQAIRAVLNAQQRVTFDENRKTFRERAQQQRDRARQERPPRPVPADGESEAGAAAGGDPEDSP